MKNSKFAAILLVVAVAFSTNAFAQKFKDLDKSPMDVAAFPESYKESNKKVKVTYSRPQLKKRDVSKLAPNGEVWRTGANEAAEITFYQPTLINKKTIAPGTYSLFTIPENNSWTIIINRASNVWGAYTYDEKMDVARLEAKANKWESTIEAFTITFEGEKNEATMYLGWGNKVVSLPMKFESPNSNNLKVIKN